MECFLGVLLGEIFFGGWPWHDGWMVGMADGLPNNFFHNNVIFHNFIYFLEVTESQSNFFPFPRELTPYPWIIRVFS